MKINPNYENQIELSIVGANSDLIEQIKNKFSSISQEINIDESKIETQPGAFEEITIALIVFTISTNVAAQLIGTFIYDMLKKNKKESNINIFIDSKEVKSQSDLLKMIEKKIKKR